ncbi:hypothetical protein N7510_010948 [Penicillium lagena]|uniref:uncharacterized protein n=1 Tax=Penicillium lagena TaxID=94218 RepID=UPI0025409265|nr:uncharacterized protein N7510_010948 [Penicillium lagena]KAJ5601414.1 hypothetical protein N7510_010948 [Penicillium lagena]
MRFQSLAVLAGVSIVVADSTVTLFIPGFDVQSLEGKILGTSGTMTTYLLNCPTSEDPNSCGLPSNGYAITEGGSSLEMAYTDGPQTVSQHCKLQGSTHVDCVASMISDSSTSALTTGIDIKSMPYGGFRAVHITATETGNASPSTDAAATALTTASTTLAHPTNFTGTVSSTSSVAATTTGTSNAAMRMITGNTRWMVGGAVALAMAVI